jgi:hypothetical protein
MATQKCPKCRSKRIRLGYHPTPLLLKAAFRYNLLCDDCNWEFNGFAIPGTVSGKTKKKRNSRELKSPKAVHYAEKKEAEINKNSEITEEIKSSAETFEQPQIKESLSKPKDNDTIPKKKVRKKVRIKLY